MAAGRILRFDGDFGRRALIFVLMGASKWRTHARSVLARANLKVSGGRPYLHRLRFSDKRMQHALGAKLGVPVAWTAADAPLNGELADVFKTIGGVHKWAHYLPIYERVLAPYRMRPIRMLEVGVFKGGSLEMWRRYLHPDSVIIGIDIDINCKQFDDPDRGVHVRIGSQADPDFLEQVAAEFGPFDVILDDGSHQAAHMIATFQNMFDAVKVGGVYIVEDIHANYWPRFRDGPLTFIDFTKHLIDAMHAHYHTANDEPDFRVGNPARRANVMVPAVTTHLAGVEFYDSVAVFRRELRELPRSIMVDGPKTL